MRRHGLRATVLALGVFGVVAANPATTGVCDDPTSSDHTSRECRIERLRARSFSVIAIVDSGINPYHIDFRLPPDADMLGIHPSEYIEGYPADAVEMRPSFDASSVAEARQRDQDQWERSSSGALTWVDGTNIIGGVSVREGEDFFDEGGHGTPVASQAAGLVYGPGHDGVLLVAVKSSVEGVQWAARQSWIDAISMSWSRISPFSATAEATWDAAAHGKIVCAATGNATVPLWFFAEQGPSWHVHVGAVHASDRQIADYSGSPADVLGITAVPAATNHSMSEEEEFAGTSGATPAACGFMAHALAEARARLGDTVEGSRGDGVLASGPAAAGPAADGLLTRREVEDAVMATADAAGSLPTDQVRGGYGIVDGASVEAALEVLFGERPRPPRDEDDARQSTTDALRDAIWGPPPE